MSNFVVGSAGNVDEFVDIESVSASVPEKKMRGSLGHYRSRPKISATKSPLSRKHQDVETAGDDPTKWAIVVYKPPPALLFSLPKSPTAPPRKKLPKPCAVREEVPGMRIRGCTPVKRPAPDGVQPKKRKLGDEPIVLSDSDSDVQEIRPQRRVFAGDRLKSPTVKSVEKRKRVASPGGGTHEAYKPEYASTDPRARVREVVTNFDNLRRRYQQEEERNKSLDKGVSLGRADLRAYNTLKDKNYRVNGVDSIMGEVPGVECGDHFYYRLELYLISLHRQTQAGIDFIPQSKSNYRDANGEVVSVAVSVIASGGYEDDRDEGDVLIYTGQGGNNSYKGVKGKGSDQELVRGNLALKNSCDLGLPVRVIRGNEVKKSGHPSPSGKIYYYDGLYDVKDCFQEVGASGNKVWKYKLVRKEGQGELLSDIVTFKGISRLPQLLKRRGERVLCEDISNGLEPKKVRVVGGEEDEMPERFQYIVKIRYPKNIRLEPATSCSCTRECWDRCPCLRWNRGEPPYNENGSLVRGKKAVYECGPQCSCGTQCFNRSSQKGIRFNLEVFKTKGKGWGVRSTDYIPQGSFICEYVGEVVHTSDADMRVSTDDYLFDLKVPKSQEKRFGDVSGLVDDAGGDDRDGDEEEDPSREEWTIDAREYGNVARFINHSCDGNLFVQCVFYEHHDLRFPHIMLFAMEKISPYTELSYDYGKGRRMR
ncbi:hypothetical protein R1sor_002060 [Riccia sorocarpa]|uniref:Uncharacterized protein n=1 Tax=Riccia sorocarpa TaxID=122646 RepID=A0ABD3GYI7_9MARC